MPAACPKLSSQSTPDLKTGVRPQADSGRTQMFALKENHRMLKPNHDEPDIPQEGMHFQLLLLATVAFLIVLFWLTELPRAKNGEVQIAAAASRISAGIQVIGCYLAFVGVLFGHKVLRGQRLPRSRPDTIEESRTSRSPE